MVNRAKKRTVILTSSARQNASTAPTGNRGALARRRAVAAQRQDQRNVNAKMTTTVASAKEYRPTTLPTAPLSHAPAGATGSRGQSVPTRAEIRNGNASANAFVTIVTQKATGSRQKCAKATCASGHAGPTGANALAASTTTVLSPTLGHLVASQSRRGRANATVHQEQTRLSAAAWASPRKRLCVILARATSATPSGHRGCPAIHAGASRRAKESAFATKNTANFRRLRFKTAPGKSVNHHPGPIGQNARPRVATAR